MIGIIVGTIGSGKTLLLTYFTLMKSRAGADIYANYHLRFPYHNLEYVEDFAAIKTKDNWFALDEAWLNMDARRSSSLMNVINSRVMLQSRKMKASAFLTVQDIMQCDVRVRNIAHLILKPKIIAWDDKDVPLLLKVEFFHTSAPNRVHKIFVPMQFDNLCIPNLYDTYEFVEELNDGKDRKRMEIYEKYKTYFGKKMHLSAEICMSEGVSKIEASLMADYIQAKQVKEAIN